MKSYSTFFLSILLFFLLNPADGRQQKKSNAEIQSLIIRFKQDQRGPYKDIRWFCEDGTFRIPQERCPEPSPQRARYKDEVEALALSNHIFLGQILATTPFQDFWDASNVNSRTKQYQVEKYLRLVDNGWILQKGQYYRGAVQIEDEENWGFNFFADLLKNDKVLEEQFLLIREAARDVPHQGDDNLNQRIRATSLLIANAYAPFMNLRIKIHGQPDSTDLPAVRQFELKHSSRLSDSLKLQMTSLITDMEKYYQPVSVSSFSKYLRRIPKGNPIRKNIEEKLASLSTNPDKEQIIQLSDLLIFIRENLIYTKTGQQRLALLDISLLSEKMLLRQAQNSKPETLGEALELTNALAQALYGTGHLEAWEWQQLDQQLPKISPDSISILTLQQVVANYRSTLEWGTGMIKTQYNPVVTTFAGFEPLAYGFLDDRVRQSLLLPLGRLVSLQDDLFAQNAGLKNKVMNIPSQGLMRGLNLGYALGELVVITDAEEVEVQSNKIYIFDRPPADLKPVAGIATVSEGNPVSHVQLLARNLGIPNMVLAQSNLEALKKFDGQQVFYAVSNAGTVIMKPAEDMNETERSLFAKITRSEDMIEIPTDDIKLEQTSIVNLRQVRSWDSGKLCGPKAANLGELKHLFPENVVEGLVIPFGIFLQHMNQVIPAQEQSYWQYLNEIFEQAAAQKEDGVDEKEVETFTLRELENLRALIKKMPLLPEFTEDLESSFVDVLGAPLGEMPVFLRSDTNMEDLKDFTGAGLNLTVFNAVEKEKIIQGIKDVWASPYTERSFKWRQSYLLNPENVYPSILIIPSVDVDYSGVLITKDILSGQSNALTVAFSRGAGGAVDGQQAESRILFEERDVLLSPARELFYNRLPTTGGTAKTTATFNNPILKQDNLDELRKVAEAARETVNTELSYALDMELGFQNDKLWLFQVRPYVENKRALASDYLQSISPKVYDSWIPTSTSLRSDDL